MAITLQELDPAVWSRSCPDTGNEAGTAEDRGISECCQLPLCHLWMFLCIKDWAICASPYSSANLSLLWSKIRCVDRSVHHHVQTKRSNNHLSCNFRKLKRTIVIFAKQYKENNVQQKSTSTNQRCNFTMHNETFPEPLHNNTKWTKLLSCYAYSSYLRWHFRISFADDNSHCYPVAIHVNAASFLMNIRESYQPSAFHHWSQPFGRYARIAKNPPTHNKLFQWCTSYHYHHYLQCHTSGL